MQGVVVPQGHAPHPTSPPRRRGGGPCARRGVRFRGPHGGPRGDPLDHRLGPQPDHALLRRRERPRPGRPGHRRHHLEDPDDRRGRRRAGLRAGRRDDRHARVRPREQRAARTGRLHGAPWRHASAPSPPPAACPAAQIAADERPRPRPARCSPARSSSCPTGSPVAARGASAAAPAVEPGPRRPTPSRHPSRVSAVDVASVASRNGVPASLARRDRLAGERLQQRHGLLRQRPRRSCRSCPAPGTTCRPTSRAAGLTPPRPSDNVRAGVLYLGQLLRRHRRRSRPGRRGLLPRPRVRPAHRHAARDAALRRQRPRAARALRRLTARARRRSRLQPHSTSIQSRRPQARQARRDQRVEVAAAVAAGTGRAGRAGRPSAPARRPEGGAHPAEVRARRSGRGTPARDAGRRRQRPSGRECSQGRAGPPGGAARGGLQGRAVSAAVAPATWAGSPPDRSVSAGQPFHIAFTRYSAPAMARLSQVFAPQRPRVLRPLRGGRRQHPARRRPARPDAARLPRERTTSPATS